MTTVGPALALFVVLALAGCGQDLKKENASLKAQVATLQKEKTNDALVGLPLDATEKTLDQIVLEAQAAHARVLLFGVRLATRLSSCPSPVVDPAGQKRGRR